MGMEFKKVKKFFRLKDIECNMLNVEKGCHLYSFEFRYDANKSQNFTGNNYLYFLITKRKIDKIFNGKLKLFFSIENDFKSKFFYKFTNEKILSYR